MIQNFDKYNSSDDEGFTQANICTVTTVYPTRARLITSLVIDINITHENSDEEHSHDLDNSKSDVSMDEVSYISV